MIPTWPHQDLRTTSSAGTGGSPCSHGLLKSSTAAPGGRHPWEMWHEALGGAGGGGSRQAPSSFAGRPGTRCQLPPLRAEESREGGHPGLDIHGHRTLLRLTFLLSQPCACEGRVLVACVPERTAGARLCAKRLVAGSSPIPPRGLCGQPVSRRRKLRLGDVDVDVNLAGEPGFAQACGPRPSVESRGAKEGG